MKAAILALISVICICPLWGQIAQSHPEYCRIPGGVNPSSADISAAVDPREGLATLYIGQGSSAIAIRLERSLIAEIAEVCPLSDGRMVVFADMGGALAVYLVNKAKASVIDLFWAYYPAVSPDQRWIAYVKFYPLHGVEGSDEYMLYDLTKTAAENRPADEPKDAIDVGRVIFPPGHENFPGSNTQLPEDQRHLGGTRLYWAPDSRAILFEDGAKNGPGIALITLDEKGAPAAFRHALTQAEICGRDIPAGSLYNWRLDQAEIKPEIAGDRPIFVDLSSSGNNDCRNHVLQLHREAFQPARVEAHGRPVYTRGTIVDGKEVTPPKKKQK